MLSFQSFLLFFAIVHPGPEHTFPQPAILKKILFQPRDLPVEQIIRRFDQADYRIRPDLRIGVFDCPAKGFVVRLGGCRGFAALSAERFYRSGKT